MVWFIGNILVYGRTRDEYKETCRKCCQDFVTMGCDLCNESASSSKKNCDSWGSIISSKGVKSTKESIKIILDAARPDGLVNMQDLQSFLGLITYKAKFVLSLSYALQPLNLLLKSGCRNSVQQNAFDKAK